MVAVWLRLTVIPVSPVVSRSALTLQSKGVWGAPQQIVKAVSIGLLSVNIGID